MSLEMDSRTTAVFSAAVAIHIDTSQPVSSQAVCARAGLRASSATVRAILARLDRAGLLYQPHASAGRIPTESGWRAYLKMLHPRLHPWDRTYLDEAGQADMNALPTQLASRLARLSGQMALVAMPDLTDEGVTQIGIVPCGRGQYLAFYAGGGRVQHKCIELACELPEVEVQSVQNLLNDKLKGMTMAALRAWLATEAATLTLGASAAALSREALPEPKLSVVVEGASGLAAQPEFTGHDTLPALLSALRSDKNLARLVEQVLDSDGLQIRLGDEHAIDGLSSLACVALPLGTPRGGAISLLGPWRMDYERLVPMLGHCKTVVARCFGV